MVGLLPRPHRRFCNQNTPNSLKFNLGGFKNRLFFSFQPSQKFSPIEELNYSPGVRAGSFVLEKLNFCFLDSFKFLTESDTSTWPAIKCKKPLNEGKTFFFCHSEKRGSFESSLSVIDDLCFFFCFKHSARQWEKLVILKIVRNYAENKKYIQCFLFK